ncbi:MAG: Fic family protein [Candidatus Methanoperedens sp.]|nr:Fic family protein [Candidatus Methanoperedens sp.]
MRIPEKPPSNKEVLDLSVQIDSKSIEELRPYLEIINSKYLHWDELPMRFKDINVNLKLLWSYAEIIRQFNSRMITLDDLTLRYVQTPQIEKELHNFDMRVGGKIDFESQMPSVDLKRKYLISSLMEEAIASSQLEGAVTTRVVAKRMLRENRKPKTHSEQMILNNYITMMYIKDNTQPNQPLTLELIKEIHKKITKDTLEKKEYEGTFRTDNDVKVFLRDGSQIIYEPPDHSTIEKLLQGICGFANTEPVEFYLHPIVKAIVLHYMIGYLHPFNDGNGRTARALFYWYLISQKYNWLEYVAISTAIKSAPSKYTRAYLYSETANNDITYFVKFNLRKIDIALRFFEEYVAKKMSENKKIFETIENNPNLNFRQADIIITLSKNEKPITISEMQERYNITYETARTDLSSLAKLGYLRMYISGQKYTFLLDKDKCMSEMRIPDKIPDKKQIKLSHFGSKDPNQVSKTTTPINNQN